MIYGNQFANPERFTGFAPRYSTKTVANSNTANNVLDGGGTASTNTSMWVMTWGTDTNHAIFPKGKLAGLQQRDMGEWPVADSLATLTKPIESTSNGKSVSPSGTGATWRGSPTSMSPN